MKTCPYCAEDIQNAAIVCKHCQRDLAKPPAPAAATQPRKGRRWLLAIALLILFAWAGCYFSPDHQAFIKFDQQRRAWHARCDAYVDKSEDVLPPSERAVFRSCADEMREMIATAKSHGWQ